MFVTAENIISTLWVPAMPAQLRQKDYTGTIMHGGEVLLLNKALT